MRAITAILAAAVAAMALPAAAGAAGDTLDIEPVQVGGYRFTLNILDSNRTDFVTVELRKRRGDSVQTHSYFLEREISFKGPNDFSRARIRGSLGSRGKLDLTYKALNPLQVDPVPEGCSGDPGLLRRGSIKGVLRFKVDSKKFGTVVLHQANAKYGHSAKYGCVNAGFPKGLVLSADRRVGRSDHFLYAQQDGSDAELTFGLLRGIERHTIEILTKRTLLTANSSATRGSLRSFGPFMSGRAAVRGERLTGSLTARFDWPGPVKFPATSNASLSRETGGS